MSTKTTALFTLVGAGLLLAGCSSGDAPDAATPASTPMSSMVMPSAAEASVSASGDIVVSGFAFEVPAKVAPGQTIIIRNGDSAEHSVTADAGDAFDVDVDGGGTATLTAPTTPGTYAFHCEYHPNMVATLTVG